MRVCVAGLIGFLLVSPLAADNARTPNQSPPSDEKLAEIIVRATRVANPSPAGTYSSVATLLRFDPQTELQSRGLAEGQSDVTVQGGVFENTGFSVGAVTIIDPQTGHYSAGLPIDPAFLSSPGILTGIDNALTGFNSNIANVSYSLIEIDQGGHISLGLGDHALWFTSLRVSSLKELNNGHLMGVSASAALSQGDGTLPHGDHDFSRYNVHLQYRQDNAQTDLMLSYQDKFYGWPGAYTGFASLAETDHSKTRLVLANYRRDMEHGWFDLSAYYRKLVDDYDFNRNTQETGVPGSFEHATKVAALGLQGSYQRGRVDWRYAVQLTSDELSRSTDLVAGHFTDRKYAKISLVPSFDVVMTDSRSLRVRAGASMDTSNRDSTVVLPVLGMNWQLSSSAFQDEYVIEYASTSQLPGYTALNSRPTGLFGGNADLGREKARQLSLSFTRQAASWMVSATVFYRKDDDLVDWTYSTSVPNSRQANAVDLDVAGFAGLVTRYWTSLELIGGYTYLHKNEDYGDTDVDASFYALNFARHRATLAIICDLTEQWRLRMDNEYRVQKNNPLRTSQDSAYRVSLSLSWQASFVDGLEVSLIADNVTDSEYQYFPGTPAVGRQISVSALYRW